MALNALVNKIKNLTVDNTTVALTVGNMVILDPTASTYTLNTLYSSLQTQLTPSSITTIEDNVNNVLVFIPNVRSAQNLVASLSTVANTVASSVQSVLGTPVSASFTNPNDVNAGANIIAAVNFVGNPNQMAYRIFTANPFQASNFVSFWAENVASFNIGTANSIQKPVNTDYVNVSTVGGKTIVRLTRTWQSGEIYTTQVIATNSSITLNPGFNHFVVSTDPNNFLCYVNGSQHKMTSLLSYSEPTSTSNVSFIIGPTIGNVDTAPANCNVKNISIFPFTQYATIIEQLYNQGENADPRTIGLSPSHYWRLNGDTKDSVDTATPLTQQAITFTF